MSLWFHRLDKKPTKLFLDFCPGFFLYLPGGFLEAFWGFLQASLFMILHTKSPGSPKSFHEAPRKLQKNSGQKSRNNFVGIFVQTVKPKGHFEINWPLVIIVSVCVRWVSQIFRKILPLTEIIQRIGFMPCCCVIFVVNIKYPAITVHPGFPVGRQCFSTF